MTPGSVTSTQVFTYFATLENRVIISLTFYINSVLKVEILIKIKRREILHPSRADADQEVGRYDIWFQLKST